MKTLLPLLLLLLCATGYSQQLHNNLLGTYVGSIPAYTLDVGQGTVHVAETGITIELTASGVVQQLDNQQKKGTWKILRTEKQYYIIAIKLEGQLAEERVIIYRKGHSMKREGIFPQPDATLHLEK